ncbi:hypothetical protein K437DRAFT_260026 [Tilletiaria anomala UBC 951]|uniref:Lipase-like C-terminal domain-containing protein n=1 Tax=Tilletiaria anomala (strain ATCC 24038 / CBS 436.72 / UBC 951) TaxID=1037660 RepID=A0A066V5N9_TILAU|nr:uncharacterized protein K437DRAFT_260026 [Tilletiaria anomala UBC 951]KDN36776.1 hypothetical protein K437DRAFT_260026 [Tilletiaria anomala UBC 951]
MAAPTVERPSTGGQDIHLLPGSFPSLPSIPSTTPSYTGSTSDEADPIEQPPLVVVEGFCCTANSLVWGDFRNWLDKGEHYWRSGRAKTEAQPCAESSACESISASPSYISSISSNSSSERARLRPYRPRRVIFAPIGPVSSIHDRACELFFALKGGVIDYGAEHAREHGHARFGRRYERGLLEDWSPQKPAHFLGHSLGGPTILKLQELLREGFFDQASGLASPSSPSSSRFADNLSETEAISSPSADAMVLSVTSVSSPFRGTQVVYILGEKPLPYPSVRFLSAGDLLTKAVHCAAYLNIGPDLLSDAWGFSRRGFIESSAAVGGADNAEARDDAGIWQGRERPHWQGFRGFLRQLKRSDWADGKDCAPWDCTIAAREEAEKRPMWGAIRGSHSARTWYRSYAAYMTMPAPASSSAPSPSASLGIEKGELARGTAGIAAALPHHIPKPSASFLSPFTLTSRLMGRYDFDQLEPRPAFWNLAAAPATAFSSPPPTLLFLDKAKDEQAKTDQRIVNGEERAAKGEEAQAPLPVNPWHTLLQSSSQQMLTPEDDLVPVGYSNSPNSAHPPALAQEPLLGGATPSLANLGSSACMTPMLSARSTSNPFYDSTNAHSSVPGGGATSMQSQEPLEQWFANDGVVPLASQYHPGPCEVGKCIHAAGLPGATPRELAVKDQKDMCAAAAAEGHHFGNVKPRSRDPSLFESGMRSNADAADTNAPLEHARQSKPLVPPMMQRQGSGAPRPRIWERSELDGGSEKQLKSASGRDAGGPDSNVSGSGSDSGSISPSHIGAAVLGSVASFTRRAVRKVGKALVDPARDPYFRPCNEMPSYTDLEAQRQSATQPSSPSPPASIRSSSIGSSSIRSSSIGSSSIRSSSIGSSSIGSSPTTAASTLYAAPPTASGRAPLPEPNIWHTFVVRDTSHAALCPLWIGTQQQRIFWSGIGSWLASVDVAWKAEAGGDGAREISSFVI